MAEEANNVEKPITLEQSQDLLGLVKVLIGDKKGRRALINHLGGDLKGTRPYYAKLHAEEVQPVVDEMIATGDPFEFTFEAHAPRWAPATVWVKVNQAVKYLVEHMDMPDNKYKKWRARVLICKKPTGVLMEYTDKIGSEDVLQKLVAQKARRKEIAKEQNTNAWKSVILDFVSNSRTKGDYKHIKGVSLTEEDITTINEMFAGNNDYFIAQELFPTEIKIIFDPDHVLSNDNIEPKMKGNDE